MLMLEACPRCKGAVARVRELSETYYSCLQCGLFSYNWPPRVALKPPAAA